MHCRKCRKFSPSTIGYLCNKCRWPNKPDDSIRLFGLTFEQAMAALFTAYIAALAFVVGSAIFG